MVVEKVETASVLKVSGLKKEKKMFQFFSVYELINFYIVFQFFFWLISFHFPFFLIYNDEKLSLQINVGQA